MERLIALEKRMMSCQDRDGQSVLQDVAESRREIQVMLAAHFKALNTVNLFFFFFFSLVLSNRK